MNVPAALAASVPPFRIILPEPDELMLFAVNVPPLRTNVPEVPLDLPILVFPLDVTVPSFSVNVLPEVVPVVPIVNSL